ncbi:flavodoxin family protein [Novosphingobium sp. KCTC 2891]|uniref:flavodoxin family protein n=1 Tax=Novosphingobium sp. KCTC 2891 TaxID=2989730 RepID=UPI00222230D8|nr:flavodoxin family protein [Novosphingobium sp. KCTC 2891]MCW1381760.1 flavodoxin family protein [Novosphingobium sp. KCTC 2891]
MLIVWHSRTGAAAQLARAVHDGAGGAVGARLLRAEDAAPEDLLAARVTVFACPENLGALSGAMKEFFDRSYYPVLGRIEGRGYATVIAAGSAGQGAEAQIDRIVTGWRLRRVQEGMIVNLGAQTPEAILAPKQVDETALQKCRDLGQALAAGLDIGLF